MKRDRYFTNMVLGRIRKTCIMCSCIDSTYEQLTIFEYLELYKINFAWGIDRYLIEATPNRTNSDRKDNQIIWNGILKKVRGGIRVEILKRRTPTWNLLRHIVYQRDHGICQVCRKDLNEDGIYNCGHIVDRCAGGIDCPCNLEVQCETCNYMKPVHENKDEYLRWVKAGGWQADILREMRRKNPIFMEPPQPEMKEERVYA